MIVQLTRPFFYLLCLIVTWNSVTLIPEQKKDDLLKSIPWHVEHGTEPFEVLRETSYRKK